MEAPQQFHSEVLTPFYDDFFQPPLNGYSPATAGLTVTEDTAEEQQDRIIFTRKLEQFALQKAEDSNIFTLLKSSKGFVIICNKCSLQLKCAKQYRANRTGANYHIMNFQRHFNSHLTNDNDV